MLCFQSLKQVCINGFPHASDKRHNLVCPVTLPLKTAINVTKPTSKCPYHSNTTINESSHMTNYIFWRPQGVKGFLWQQQYREGCVNPGGLWVEGMCVQGSLVNAECSITLWREYSYTHAYIHTEIACFIVSWQSQVWIYSPKYFCLDDCINGQKLSIG